MHFIHYMLYSLLPSALALQGRPEIPRDVVNSALDPTSSKNPFYPKRPYCPGRKVDESIQKQIFAHFVKVLYDEKNISKAFETYVDSNIIEHDPEDLQDRNFIIQRLEQIIPYVTSTILFSSFGDDTGLIYLKVEDDPEPIALADIYRMDGTCIVEHWDVQQARPANATNPLAMF
jgi:predicted SnoaL-like aldol condensation-catalyzing enzyme